MWLRGQQMTTLPLHRESSFLASPITSPVQFMLLLSSQRVMTTTTAEEEWEEEEGAFPSFR